MKDSYGREIDYLRISVTQNCNLSCYYCFPQKCSVPHNNCNRILSAKDIAKIVTIAIRQFSFKKVRLTGGEPLVYPYILQLVYSIAKIDGLQDFSMTTNGILLEKFASCLALAGLHRINISLDTTNAKRYFEITKGGNIENVFRGIDAAKKAKLVPIKLNCVIKDSITEDDAMLVQEFAAKNNLEVRFIRQMNLHTGKFSKVMGGPGGDCKHCNRIRFLSDGTFKPCLFSNLSFDIKKFGVNDAIKKTIINKPQQGELVRGKWMFQIGG